MRQNRVTINKADNDGEGVLYRLTDIEPQFVSLVTAGANRQKKFQVVKADDGQDHENTTNKGADDASAVVDDANVPDGTGDPSGQNDDGDLIDWLEEASKSVGETLDDARVTELLTAEPTVADTSPAEPPAQKVDKSSDKIEKAFNALQAEFATEIAKNKKLSDAVEKQTDTIAKLKKQLSTVTGERNKYRKTAVKLRNGVGGTTALTTGNVSDVGKKEETEDPKTSPWASGGDLTQKIDN